MNKVGSTGSLTAKKGDVTFQSRNYEALSNLEKLQRQLSAEASTLPRRQLRKTKNLDRPASYPKGLSGDYFESENPLATNVWYDEYRNSQKSEEVVPSIDYISELDPDIFQPQNDLNIKADEDKETHQKHAILESKYRLSQFPLDLPETPKISEVIPEELNTPPVTPQFPEPPEPYNESQSLERKEPAALRFSYEPEKSVEPSDEIQTHEPQEIIELSELKSQESHETKEPSRLIFSYEPEEPINPSELQPHELKDSGEITKQKSQESRESEEQSELQQQESQESNELSEQKSNELQKSKEPARPESYEQLKSNQPLELKSSSDSKESKETTALESSYEPDEDYGPLEHKEKDVTSQKVDSKQDTYIHIPQDRQETTESEVNSQKVEEKQERYTHIPKDTQETTENEVNNQNVDEKQDIFIHIPQDTQKTTESEVTSQQAEGKQDICIYIPQDKQDTIKNEKTQSEETDDKENKPLLAVEPEENEKAILERYKRKEPEKKRRKPVGNVSQSATLQIPETVMDTMSTSNNLDVVVVPPKKEKHKKHKKKDSKEKVVDIPLVVTSNGKPKGGSKPEKVKILYENPAFQIDEGSGSEAQTTKEKKKGKKGKDKKKDLHIDMSKIQKGPEIRIENADGIAPLAVPEQNGFTPTLTQNVPTLQSKQQATNHLKSKKNVKQDNLQVPSDRISYHRSNSKSRESDKLKGSRSANYGSVNGDNVELSDPEFNRGLEEMILDRRKSSKGSRRGHRKNSRRRRSIQDIERGIQSR